MKDKEHEYIVDVVVVDTASNKPPRRVAQRCRLTPKRIYTIGGAIYLRDSGEPYMNLSDRTWGSYRKRADVSSIRKADQ